jgi:RNA polymerase sigma factor (sigma-70 family)
LSRPRVRADDDTLLLRRAADGDDSAFEGFHDRHVDALIRYCHHLLGSRHDAEDAVQQSFFSAYREIAAGRLPEKPKAWLYAIARNRSLSTLRSRREHPAELADPPTLPLSDEVERRADLRQLVRDVNRLPEDQRSAIVLFELADLPQADIAQVIGREPEQVKSLVYQARATLMARRSARDVPCNRVQQRLAVARRGELASRMIRNHLDGCEQCTRYLEDLRRHRRGLALIFPAAPVLAVASSGGSGAVAGAVAAKGRHLHHTTYAAAAAAGAAVVAGAVVAVLAAGPDGGNRAAGLPAQGSGASVRPAAVSPPRAGDRDRPRPEKAEGRASVRKAPVLAAALDRPAVADRGAGTRRPSVPPGPPPAGDNTPDEPGQPAPGSQSPPTAEPQVPAAPPPPPAVPPPTVVAAPPVAAPRHDNGNHYGQIRNGNNGNHYGHR